MNWRDHVKAIKALEDLLLAVRNESPDDFADFFYATAYDLGTDFDDAEDYFAFMDPERLSKRLADLLAAGIDEGFLVQATLDHMDAGWRMNRAGRAGNGAGMQPSWPIRHYRSGCAP